MVHAAASMAISFNFSLPFHLKRTPHVRQFQSPSADHLEILTLKGTLQLTPFSFIHINISKDWLTAYKL